MIGWISGAGAVSGRATLTETTGCEPAAVCHDATSAIGSAAATAVRLPRIKRGVRGVTSAPLSNQLHLCIRAFWGLVGGLLGQPHRGDHKGQSAYASAPD